MIVEKKQGKPPYDNLVRFNKIKTAERDLDFVTMKVNEVPRVKSNFVHHYTPEYDLAMDDLSVSPTPHIVRFGSVARRGDLGVYKQNASLLLEDWYFECGLAGTYHIDSMLRLYFYNTLEPSTVEFYLANTTSSPNAYLTINGLQRLSQDLFKFDFGHYQQTNNNYYYTYTGTRYEQTRTGSTDVYLKAGDKVRLMLGLYKNLVVALNIKVTGFINIHYINDNKRGII